MWPDEPHFELNMVMETKTALVLTGGGARAAYQAGVLSAIQEMLDSPHLNPFPVICASSGGAVNAAFLALGAEQPAQAMDALLGYWQNLQLENALGHRWFSGILNVFGHMTGWSDSWPEMLGKSSMFDATPLHRHLNRLLDFTRLEGAIASGALHALSLSCFGYNSGQSLSFFQGRADLDPWKGGGMTGAHVTLGVDHVMASGAIPLLLPPIRLNREFFGDGAIGRMSPLLPALHLGAEKVLAISTAGLEVEVDRPETGRLPSPARVAGHLLSDFYFDAQMVAAKQMRAGAQESSILVIAPTKRLDVLAAQVLPALPTSARKRLGKLGPLNEESAACASYLLFDAAYAAALIDLGRSDALARREEITRFLEET